MTASGAGLGIARQVLAALILSLMISVAAMTVASAEPYRLVAGDRLTVGFVAQGLTEEIPIDIDGQIRLSELGGLTVTGLTLDEAETRIAESVEEAGLYINARVSLAVESYAPIIVAGDVTRPGSFSYIPGMTVSAALALSGGSQAAGVSRFEIDRARTEVEGSLKRLNLQIAASVARVARFEALIEGSSDYVLSESLRSVIPAPGAVDLDALTSAEAELLTNAIERGEELLGFWEEEISSIETQQALFDQRIEVQNEIVASVAADLDTAQDLRDRGLQTASRLSTVEQRDADARARALELESAQIRAAQAISDARRARSQFLSSRRSDALAALQEVRIGLDEAQLRYAQGLEQLALLTGGNMGTLLFSDAIETRFQIQSLREGRENLTQITPQTRLLPGDTLFVVLEPVGAAAN
ncbi:polysaccharide biosynthesis/export family protein [Salipiger abyssi]|uniref:SLBB domain-containing protein n=1 Tax=Salipiger abyssi TaxID=1250539 RepID=A0A1P8UU10_9RHOB|nr:polysaccharide biosynthesis/export family protein [Salipiger abyssi]APZ52871.1 SLBB domain-containing protein [Salipiger abyssi]